ncbi:uncharacterized protein LOC123491469 [Coregonus clupeaformis]|uniref:uncharacterized protein LOC123491469 n=1 Tax=Coregonus clupeaformis TaxID=59861 RepID=UPI001E1C600F|nr:uncharacterized protein LOC123491469 [Coregonus clupeaformis]
MDYYQHDMFSHIEKDDHRRSFSQYNLLHNQSSLEGKARDRLSKGNQVDMTTGGCGGVVQAGSRDVSLESLNKLNSSGLGLYRRQSKGQVAVTAPVPRGEREEDCCSRADNEPRRPATGSNKPGRRSVVIWERMLLLIYGTLLGIFLKTGYALQIQCYQCEEVKNDECSTAEFIVNCTVNVQDMCQKEVLVKEDGIFYRKSCASSGACLISSSGYQQFCTGRINSVCISCCNTPLCNGPRKKNRPVPSAATSSFSSLLFLLVSLTLVSLSDIDLEASTCPVPLPEDNTRVL